MPETKVTASELLSGDIRTRQGGYPDNFSIPGTNNYEEVKKSMEKQIGASTSNNTTVNVTFDHAFANVPLVLVTIVSTTLAQPVVTDVTTTGFSYKVGALLTGVLTSGIQINWMAEGRRVMS